MKAREELEFQNHYAHEKEIYMGLISSSESESSLKKDAEDPPKVEKPKLTLQKHEIINREQLNRSVIGHPSQALEVTSLSLKSQ